MHLAADRGTCLRRLAGATPDSAALGEEQSVTFQPLVIGVKRARVSQMFWLIYPRKVSCVYNVYGVLSNQNIINSTN